MGADAYIVENYGGEHQLDAVIRLMEVDLSEPYNVFTYRFFVDKWPELSFLAFSSSDVLPNEPSKEELAALKASKKFYARCSDNTWKRLVGGIVCKMEPSNKTGLMRGYIAMLAVDAEYRRHGIGRDLTRRAIDKMIEGGAEEITLETETSNTTSLAFYQRFGFIRERCMLNYYLFAGDAYKLVLPLPPKDDECPVVEPAPTVAEPVVEHKEPVKQQQKKPRKSGGKKKGHR